MSDIQDHSADETINDPAPIKDEPYTPQEPSYPTILASDPPRTGPLDANERNRLSWLRSKPEEALTAQDEIKERDDLAARENIPEEAPPAEPAPEAPQVMHTLFGEMAGMFEHLAGVLPAAGPLTPRLVAFRQRLAALKDML